MRRHKRRFMQYIKGIGAYQNTRDTAITFGKFDGLHQGHELLIERVVEHQRNDDVDGVVVAFDMTPLFQKQNKTMEVLLSNPEKAKLLEGRIDYFIDCPFDDNISKIEAERFIEDIIVVRGLHKSLDKEAVRVIKKMPKWKPGKNYKGEVQDYKYTIPVTFKLPK